MQDRFRFRVWNIKEKEMIYNAEIAYDGMNYSTEWQLGHNTNDGHVDCFAYYLDYEHEEYEIMQCTGLKDHTGKLIFEGDIVKLSYNGGQFTLFGDKFSENPEPDYFLVEWSDDWQQYFCRQLPLNYSRAIQLEKLHVSFEHDLYPNDADVKARRELNHAILVNDYNKFSEVIGNIYENPELLEGEK